MNLLNVGRALVCALGIASVSPAALAAPPPPEFVQFSPGATKGALYRPDPEIFPDAHIGVVVMHRNSNYLSHASTRELSARGFFVLGMNPRCDNNEAACAPWENNALDVRSGVNYLRELPEISHVVLLGHSGGGPTMSFYQAVAETGAEFCRQESKLIQCTNNGFNTPLTPADGIILMDSHPGNTINSLRSVHGGVTNDRDILAHNALPVIDPALDPFSAENGFDENGSTYSPEFIEAYHIAQARRMNTLIEIALERLAHVEENGLGDAAFIVPMTDGARLMQTDLSIHAGTEQPRNLLLNDGTVVSDAPVMSVRVPSLSAYHPEDFGNSSFLTLRSFLSVRAIPASDSLDGIEWCASNNSTPCNLANVSVPLLVTAMGGHYFIRDSEHFFDEAASPDKEFYVIEGASHGGTPCNACAETQGQYSNSATNLFDLMASWMNERF